MLIRYKKLKRQTKQDLLLNPPRLFFQKDTSGWTAQQKFDEIVKCKLDPIYWMETYGVVKHQKRGKIRFEMYDFQKEAILKFLNPKTKHMIIVKSRQLGISTVFAALCCWLAIFYEQKDMLVVATKAGTAKGFLVKVKLFYQYTPRWLKPGVLEWNKMNLGLDNGCNLTVSTTTVDAARSESLSLLVIDEAAIIKNSTIEEIWTSAAPTMSTGGKCVMLSTPNGASGFFYETYKSAEQNEENVAAGRIIHKQVVNFLTMNLPWQVHPERDEAWFEEEKKTLKYDARRIGQELCCDFVTSGKKAFDPEVLRWLKDNKVDFLKDAFLKNEIDGILKSGIDEVFSSYGIIEESEQKMMLDSLRNLLDEGVRIFYTKAQIQQIDDKIFGVDVGAGDGGDATPIIGVLPNGEVFSSFIATIPPKFGAILSYLMSNYYEAGLAIERNSYGLEIVERLTKDLGSEYVKQGHDGKDGFWTGAKLRDQYISRAKESVSDINVSKRARLNDTRILGELETFIWKNGKAQAQSGNHDDTIMAYAIARYCYFQNKNISQPMGIYSNGMLNNVKLVQTDKVCPREIETVFLKDFVPYEEMWSNKKPKVNAAFVGNDGFTFEDEDFEIQEKMSEYKKMCDAFGFNF